MLPFIGELSFDAFNEGTRLKHYVIKQKFTGERGSGRQRQFCKENEIETSFFTEKGRTGKMESEILQGENWQ